MQPDDPDSSFILSIWILLNLYRNLSSYDTSLHAYYPGIVESVLFADLSSLLFLEMYFSDAILRLFVSFYDWKMSLTKPFVGNNEQ